MKWIEFQFVAMIGCLVVAVNLPMSAQPQSNCEEIREVCSALGEWVEPELTAFGSNDGVFIRSVSTDDTIERPVGEEEDKEEYKRIELVDSTLHVYDMVDDDTVGVWSIRLDTVTVTESGWTSAHATVMHAPLYYDVTTWTITSDSTAQIESDRYFYDQQEDGSMGLTFERTSRLRLLRRP